MAVKPKFRKGDIVKHRGNRWLYEITGTCRVNPSNGAPFDAYIFSVDGKLFVHDKEEMEANYILRKRWKLEIMK